MTREEWLAQIKVGDTVIPHINGTALAPELVTRASRMQVSIGKYSKVSRFSRKTGRLARTDSIRTVLEIRSPDAVPIETVEAEKAPAKKVATVKVTESLKGGRRLVEQFREKSDRAVLLDQYRAGAMTWAPANSRTLPGLWEACRNDIGVYLLWKGPRLLYVGSSKLLFMRLGQHRATRRGIKWPTKVTILNTRTHKEAIALESKLIRELLPSENVVVLV